MRSGALLILVAAAIAGCGSAGAGDLPDPAQPRFSGAASERPAGRVSDLGITVPLQAPVAVLGRGSELATLDPRGRVLELFDARTGARRGRADAGVGPTTVVTDGVELLYVVDTEGDALLVFHTRPELELTRRVHLPGSPYGIAIDRGRRRLWVTLTELNAIAHLSAGSRPRPLARLAAVPGPVGVAVDAVSGRLSVNSHDGRLQVIERP